MAMLKDMGKDFGVFYPTGHMVVGFTSFPNAKAVITNLKSKSPLFDDITSVTPQEMIDFAEENLVHSGVISKMGAGPAILQKFLEAARTGSHFLVIPTPDDDAANIVTEALSKTSHLLAQRYHLLAIEDIL